MPQKSWAVGEEVLAADFNTYVQQQVVPAFASTATRDSQWTTPPNGALSVTTDTNTLWQRAAGVWVAGPSGGAELGYVENTAPAGFAPGTTETDVPSLTASVTLAATRKVKVTARYLGIVNTANTIVTLKIRYGGTTGATGTTIQQLNWGPFGAGQWVHAEMSVRKSLVAATYTFRVTASTVTAGTTWGLQSDPTYPSFLMVQDLGG